VSASCCRRRRLPALLGGVPVRDLRPGDQAVALGGLAEHVRRGHRLLAGAGVGEDTVLVRRHHDPLAEPIARLPGDLLVVPREAEEPPPVTSALDVELHAPVVVHAGHSGGSRPFTVLTR